jgi:DNA polymerase-3 subunit epsilon
MNIQLSKPIAFFDLETTGINVAKDRIVEISIEKIQPDGQHIVKTQRINPEMPIPAESSEIHGITNEMVANEPTFQQFAKELIIFLHDCDLGGFNSNSFDIPLLMEEFQRVGIEFQLDGRRFIDVQNIFHKMEQRTLSAAYKFYCDKELENAHSAEADIKATSEIFFAQLERYEELEKDMDFLHNFSRRNKNIDIAGRISEGKNGEAVFNFGKHKGESVAEVFKRNPGYYNWMMQGEFPVHTKQVIREIFESIASS